MREIKFRAWDKRDKKIREISDISWLNQEFNDEPFMVGFESGAHLPSTASEPEEWIEDTLWINASDVEIMQYTGLKDKNGTEIYEGDIVKIGDVIEPVRGEGKYWIEKNFIVKFNGQSYSTERLEESEIIGNIYENPELLNQSVR